MTVEYASSPVIKALLGADIHGEPGPFGTWTDEHDQEPDHGPANWAEDEPHC